MLYLIYEVLEIPRLETYMLYAKHNHPSTRYLWCRKSEDHIYNSDKNQHD